MADCHKEYNVAYLKAHGWHVETQPHKRLGAESDEEPTLRQIIEALQQVMCTHDAEKLAISVLEIGHKC